MSDSNSEDSNHQDPTITMHTQSKSMPTTTVRQQSNGRVAVTIPKAVATALGITDSESKARDVRLRVRCDGGAIALDATIGDLDGGYNVRTASVKHGSVQLSLPRFMAVAWGLPGCELAWPDPDDVESAEGEPQLFSVGVRGWEPTFGGDIEQAAAGEVWQTSIHASERSDGGYNWVTSIPSEAAREVGLLQSDPEVAISLSCVGDRPVAELEPVDIDGPATASVNLTGPDGGQPRLSTKDLPIEFGVADRLRSGESVHVLWVTEGERLYAAVPPEGWFLSAIRGD